MVTDLKNLKLMGDLAGVIKNSKNPIISWSGGKDSTLLLGLALQMGFKPAVLTFPHFWTKRQMEFMLKWVDKHKLTVFSYSPTEINFRGRYITADYWMGGVPIKMIMDHVPSKRCGIDIGKAARSESYLQPAYLWDATIVGTKGCDKHELVTEFTFIDTERHSFIKPLWDWTDKEVLEGLDTFKIDFDHRAMTSDPEGDTGNFVACMGCVGHDRKVYCPKLKKTIQGVNN